MIKRQIITSCWPLNNFKYDFKYVLDETPKEIKQDYNKSLNTWNNHTEGEHIMFFTDMRLSMWSGREWRQDIGSLLDP